ncbi:retrovirus-related Pol polyprotein from transposon RE1 [Gossypium arboreum]|uniref:retrovirus-related Pol polyprotein from transposon RE1 n=1 Tax=Gossypium arboreum TaxID=29729 RepID=UPI0008192C31|nr:retrovirus-related Pol polyprotein from transposon RE1 [Gossypium arboreum]
MKDMEIEKFRVVLIGDDGCGLRFFSTKKISVILDDDNFLLWRQQVLLAIKTYKLQQFLDSCTVPPPATLPDADGIPQENPEFSRFEQQDSALASWLLSSISTTVLPHLIGMGTSAQIWNAIASLYGSKTTSHLMFFRRALHSQRKGDLSMKDFLMKIKGFCDNLANCGEVISEREHVTAILNGLPPEYDSVITIITASHTPYTVQGVMTMLIDAEARHQTMILEFPSLENVVTHQTTGSATNNDTPPAYRPSTGSRGRGRGRGRSSGSRIQCQLCGKMGHLVDRCYHRFDLSYKNTGYRPSSSQVGSSPPPYMQPGWVIPPTSPMSWNANTPQTSYTSTVSTSSPQAYVATPETVYDNAWFPDSSATHHLTHSATAIGESTPYNGPGKIYVGNGSALPVHSTGQSSLLTRTCPSYMRSLLHVTGITKNLLSVSQFTKDNNVMFEFLPTQCQVRDLHTKEVLLRGSVHHGLYRLQLKDNFQSRHCSAHGLTASGFVPVSLWHARLGHPCTSTLTKALSHCNVPFVSNKDYFDCVACHLGKERNLPFSHSASEYVTPLSLVVANVWGPAPISLNGFRYYVAFTDACTRYTWVYFMRQKSEVSTIFP